MTSNTRKKPLVLLILDGWGYREHTDSNAIYHADTPTWDALWNSAPRALVSGSGLDVGLPDGQMGNSEVGHMSLGAGRVIYQNITRIDKAIDDGSFFDNAAYCQAVDKAMARDGAVHILGLLSPGGVHSHENHLVAMVELAAGRGCKKVYVHGFLDGRDTPPRSAKAAIERINTTLAELQCGRIASIVGRYYAMDRDQRWDRVEQAWRLLTKGDAPHLATDPVSALEAAYERGEDDEFVVATRIQAEGQTDAWIKDGDAVIFMNFRSDRARELSHAFIDQDFDGYDRQAPPQLADFVTTTPYAADIAAACAFPVDALRNSIGEYLSELGMTQLRIAETEKYAHVTFFFSGGREQLFPGEQRILVDSPKVATYDLQPEMSAPEVTDKLVEAIGSQQFDVIVCNYANGDMVGHTGNFDAAVKAVAAIDQSLRRIIDALKAVDGECLITADHGNCEQMLDHSGIKHTQHTTELVPFIYVGKRPLAIQQQGGKLSDIAPSMLSLLGLPQPEEMSGHSLIELQ
jgi:2,3-bisphosphoglycerate-independent phosphoglycerate mutase